MNLAEMAELVKFGEMRRDFYRRFDLEIEFLGLIDRVTVNQLEFGRGVNNEGVWSCPVLTPSGLAIKRVVISPDSKPYSDGILQLLVGEFARAAGYNDDLQMLASLAEEGNRIKLDGFSNPSSEAAYRSGFKDDPDLAAKYSDGRQCGGCSFFAPLDSDWGLCLHKKSKHFRETVFEHFSCHDLVDGGWGAHSFSTDTYREDK